MYVMRETSTPRFLIGQFAIVAAAIAAYFGVRGITEGDPAHAHDHARTVLALESDLGLDVEQRIQRLIESSDVIVTLSNWIYIWLHWPVIGLTLIWLPGPIDPTISSCRTR